MRFWSKVRAAMARVFGVAEDSAGELVGQGEKLTRSPWYEITPYSSVVEPAKLTRGSWPSPDQLVALRSSGYAAVVNLCAERDDATAVAAAGMGSVHIPLVDGTAPSPAWVDFFLRVVDHCSPVYVHCEQGKGRTGCMVAAYRVLRQGWPPEKALAEAEKYGLELPGQKHFILSLES